MVKELFDRSLKNILDPILQWVQPLVYSWYTFCPCVSSLEEMCISCLKEMRGPQYGDLQWVLGMHRDTHLHFPNGNSARQDLGGGRKFWRYHLLLGRDQQQQQQKQHAANTVIKFCPHYISLAFCLTTRGSWEPKLYIYSPKVYFCAKCHFWATIGLNQSHCRLLWFFWIFYTKYEIFIPSVCLPLPPCSCTNCTTTGHVAHYPNPSLICKVIWQ